MKLIRINTADSTFTEDPLPPGRAHYGGRMLTSSIIAEEVPPLCSPLGANNKLVFANGIFAGHANAPCSGRISVGCKSPLTGGIKESNTGGDGGCHLARHGIRAIVLEGLPADDGLRLIHVSADGVEIQPADQYAGLNTYDMVEAARRDFGEKISVVCIGSAGERRMNGSSVAFTSIEGPPSRHAARGGVGAVMGSKGIKAIVIDHVSGSGVPITDEPEFKKLCGEFARELHDGKAILRDYGTANLVNVINEVGGLPTRNFSAGRFESAESISGEQMRENIDARGGAHGRPCMPGCPIQCANRYVSLDGTVTDDVEYESIVLLGSNCGIGDMDTVAKLERACDDLGLDTIETGATIAVCMEGGVIEFGDGEGALGLMDEIAKGTPLGKIVGSGAECAARVLGVRRVPTVKGQSLAAYDPRAVKGMGVTYITTPMGADHTAGAAIPNRPGIGELELDTFSKQDKELLSIDLQLMTGALDALGVCMFTGPQVSSIEMWAKIMTAATGDPWTPTKLLELAEEMIDRERDFNRRAGFTEKDDRLPEHFYTEPLAPKDPVMDVDDAQAARITGGELRASDRWPEE